MNFKLRKKPGSAKVIDITVANTHTFTVGNSKMIVHNCFLPYLDDSAEGLVDTLSEVNWLSMLGGGIGIGIGIRSADDKSVGVMPHLRTYDASSLAYRQGRTRRGSYAVYLDISHPDILMFLDMRKPTGDPNMRALNLHHGINISDDFMEIIERCMIDPKADDTWELKDPHNGTVREKVSARELWQRVLELRMQTGEPYIHFLSTSNKAMPEFQKKLGLSIRQSNLCVAGDTKIRILDIITNEESIQEIGHFINELYEPNKWLVWSYNIDTNECEWKQITAAAMTNQNAEILEIEDSVTGKIIRCTPEHKIYTKNRGYVMAKDLVESDELVIKK